MQPRERRNPVIDERGIALPMSLMVLALLSTLTVAFLSLAKSEPVIAGNLGRAVHARALAESGAERALWALGAGDRSPAPTWAIANPMAASTAPAPYNGLSFIGTSSLGGAFVTVSRYLDPSTSATVANQRNISATGWSPTNAPAPGQPAAHRTVQAVAIRLPNLAASAPCALCVMGELQLASSLVVDARADQTCGAKYGTYTTSTTSVAGGAKVYGAVDGNTVANQATDMRQNQAAADFAAFTLSADDLTVLKTLARARGTYYQGTVAFSASSKAPNGIVFVDTVSGGNPTATTASSDLAAVTISGTPFLGTAGDGIFRGWLVVNGTLSISGTTNIHGLVYAANDFSYNGSPGGTISGLVISLNLLDSSATTVDSTSSGNASIVFNCLNAKGAGVVPEAWFVKPGSYKEVSD